MKQMFYIVVGLWLFPVASFAHDGPLPTGPTTPEPRALAMPQHELDTRGDWDDANATYRARCGSQFGMNAATRGGVWEAALELGNMGMDPITVSRGDSPRLIVQKDNVKVWLRRLGISKVTYSFPAQLIANMTMFGVAYDCCPFVKEGDPCQGYGILGEVPGAKDAILSINNDDGPELVPCNNIGGCP